MKDWSCVLGGGELDEGSEVGDFFEMFKYEDLVDVIGLGVNGLVDEGWCLLEVVEVVDGDIFRVWVFRIEFWDEFVFNGMKIGMVKVLICEGV